MFVDNSTMLHPIIREGILEHFLTNLGFILANDHCRRGCTHCPAYGDQQPVQYMPFPLLKQVVKTIGQAFHTYGMEPARSISSWRISDPLDYFTREGELKRTTYDVARLWKECLHQRLYLVTNGTEGKSFAKEALNKIVQEPDLLSQMKLTITTCDVDWGKESYFEHLAWDVQTLAPLWDLPSLRIESPHDPRFRINLKVTDETREETLDFIMRLLKHIGYAPQKIASLINDPSKIVVKQIYDLGSVGGASPIIGVKSITKDNQRYKPTPETRTQYQYIIYPDGLIGMADMYAFGTVPFSSKDGGPLKLNTDLRPIVQ